MEEYSKKFVNEVMNFFQSELKNRFQSKKLKRIFFEFGEYYTWNDPEIDPADWEQLCVDFHLVAVSQEDFDKVKNYYMNEYNYTENQALETCENSGEYIDEEDTKVIRYEFETLRRLELEYEEVQEIAEEICSKFKTLDFSTFNTTEDFEVKDINYYD